MFKSSVKKILLFTLILAIVFCSAFALVGCDNYITLYTEFGITNQYSSFASCKKGQLLHVPTPPTYVDRIFTTGVVGFTGTHPDNSPFSIEITRVNEGYDIDSDYLFVGWYKDAEFTTPWDFAVDRITVHETRIYAKWEIIK